MNEELGQVNQEVYTKSSMLRSCNIAIGFQFKVRNSNKKVHIKFSANNAFLEYPSKGTLKIERLESQIT
jgi:hypothetical protein